MYTFYFLFGVFLIVLVIAGKIPGVKELIKPVTEGVASLISAILAELWSWFIYMGKAIGKAHFEFFRHLTHSPEDIDPTTPFREQERINRKDKG